MNGVRRRVRLRQRGGDRHIARVPVAAPVIAVAGMLGAVWMAGCATETGNLAPEVSLEPAGWLDVALSLEGDDFADYVADVRRRLTEARIPLDPARADLEFERAAPVQLDPVDGCDDDVRGIAILAHGLSDNAFAMRDMARLFAERCYIARTALLPGHGTRAGDLLVVDHEDWTDTVRHLAEQASREHERTVLVGFSLGAVAMLTVALDESSPVDAVVAVSPAYRVSTWSYARLAPWVHRLYPRIDKGQADDAMRYESMPTRGIAELARALNAMHDRIDERGGYDRPWMLVQSMDDSTTVPGENQAFVLENARDPRSRVLNFFTDAPPYEMAGEGTTNVAWLPGTDADYRVNGLSHLAVHVAPVNPHYGADGDYRHCGGVDGRDLEEARRCLEASGADVAYADWSRLPPAGGPPTAISSFNPAFDEMAAALTDFLGTLDP